MFSLRQDNDLILIKMIVQILEELKNQSPGNEIHLNDVSPFSSRILFLPVCVCSIPKDE